MFFLSRPLDLKTDDFVGTNCAAQKNWCLDQEKKHGPSQSACGEIEYFPVFEIKVTNVIQEGCDADVNGFIDVYFEGIMTIGDLFGVSDDDARTHIPGVPAQWILQRYKNNEGSACGCTTPCFKPFEHWKAINWIAWLYIYSTWSKGVKNCWNLQQP